MARTVMYNAFISDVAASPEDVHLTKRESEVLDFLIEGLANKDIANALNVALPTIKLHVSNIFKKLNVKNRTQAALMAFEMGLV